MPNPTPAAPFHAAQDAALRGSTALATAMGTGGKGILTDPPANVVPPYVVLGQTQILLQNDDCAAEAEVFATVNLWSRTNPLDKGAQARAMGAASVDALNVELAVPGWDCIVWELTSERYVTDPDQSTHGILEFHYLLTKQVS